jgi:ribosomal protein L31
MRDISRPEAAKVKFVCTSCTEYYRIRGKTKYTFKEKLNVSIMVLQT